MKKHYRHLLAGEAGYKRAWKAAGRAMARVLPAFAAQPPRRGDHFEELGDAKEDITRAFFDDFQAPNQRRCRGEKP